MEGKRKVLAILIILLLMTLPLGIVQASNTIKNNTKNKYIPVEITTLNSDNILKTETIHISEQDLEEFENSVSILDVKIPQVSLPMNPGKNMTVICETIAMNQLLKLHGHHTAKEFNRRLKDFMKKKQTTISEYEAKVLHRDFE